MLVWGHFSGSLDQMAIRLFKHRGELYGCTKHNPWMSFCSFAPYKGDATFFLLWQGTWNITLLPTSCTTQKMQSSPTAQDKIHKHLKYLYYLHSLENSLLMLSMRPYQFHAGPTFFFLLPECLLLVSWCLSWPISWILFCSCVCREYSTVQYRGKTAYRRLSSAAHMKWPYLLSRSWLGLTCTDSDYKPGWSQKKNNNNLCKKCFFIMLSQYA